jgi:hypothetical protein
LYLFDKAARGKMFRALPSKTKMRLHTIKAVSNLKRPEIRG